MATSALRLTLRYIDKPNQIDLSDSVTAPSHLTVQQLIKGLLEFTCVTDIAPEHVCLVKIIRGEMFYGFLTATAETTLKQLRVTDGCVLHFGPTADAPPPKALQLTIWGVEQIKSIEVRWYQAITTLAMLVEEIVEKFDLSAVNRESLHILTSVEELDISLHSKRRLSELNVFDRMSIYVQIVSPQPRPPSTASLVVKDSATPKRKTARRLPRSPLGLVNFGNTCYMNSAFQCLAHLPPLTNFFLQHAEGEFGELTDAFASLLASLREKSELPVTPTALHELVSRKDTRFSTAEQQDAQEFLSFLLESLQEELKTKAKNGPTIVQQLFFGEMKSTLTCAECEHQESTSHPMSFISIPLQRLERTFWVNFIGKNGEVHKRYVEMPVDARVEHLVEAFTALIDDRRLFYSILAMTPVSELEFDTPLEQLPGDEIILIEQEMSSEKVLPQISTRFAKRATLLECLEEFFSLETLEEHWTCQAECCRKKTLANKQLQLSVLPPVLMIQLKRFSHNNTRREKIQTFVEYPVEQFDLKKFVPQGSQKTIYHLIAVCYHHGSIHGGHYTASARHLTENEDQWYQFDDSLVTRLSPEIDLVNRDAYLLFYIRNDLLEKPFQSTPF